MHRAAHSYKDLGVWKGDSYFPTGCIYGFILLTLKVWKTYGSPQSRLVVCWDAGYDHRIKLYPEYKANRRVAREEGEPSMIPFQKGALERILETSGWAQAISMGYEADDVMATLAKQESGTVAIYTGDQDLHQTVTDSTHVISSNKGKDIIWDLERVMEKWGVTPNRIPEVKGLAGDGGDNIPGCPGCGMGWAKKLLNRYETLEQMIEVASLRNLSGFYEGKAWKSPSLTQKVKDNAALIRISRDLAQIVDCPINITTGTPDQDLLVKFFSELEFASLLKEPNLARIGEISTAW